MSLSRADSVLVFSMLVAGCSKAPTTTKPTSIDSVPELQNIKVPIWSDKEGEKATKADAFYIVKDKPPYYKGDLPVTINRGKFTVSGGIGIAYHDFAEFQNTFIYTDTKSKIFRQPDGARTLDKTGRLLAEAKHKDSIVKNEQLEGIEIEEFHYNSAGKLIFKCFSHIDLMGYKQREGAKIGSKEREYYFVWPVPD